MPTGTIVAFLCGIGIGVVEGDVPEYSFLPGVRFESGALVFDRARLTWLGDLLHEAGHIAVTPPSSRASLSGALQAHQEHPDGGEAEATAWAFASCVKIGLPADMLFHHGGYHSRSDALVATCSLGVYPRSAGVVRCGMTDAGRYPTMLH